LGPRASRSRAGRQGTRRDGKAASGPWQMALLSALPGICAPSAAARGSRADRGRGTRDEPREQVAGAAAWRGRVARCHDVNRPRRSEITLGHLRSTCSELFARALVADAQRSCVPPAVRRDRRDGRGNSPKWGVETHGPDRRDSRNSYRARLARGRSGIREAREAQPARKLPGQASRPRPGPHTRSIGPLELPRGLGLELCGERRLGR